MPSSTGTNCSRAKAGGRASNPAPASASYNQAFQVIADHSRTLVLRGMDSAGQRRRYDVPEPPHKVVLSHLLERVNDYCKRQGEHVLAIADEVGEQAVHRNHLARYRRYGTDGYRSRKLTQFVDTLHFAPSAASRLIQAIDLVTFLYRRMETHSESDPRAKRANEALWARIMPLIAHRHCWHPG